MVDPTPRSTAADAEALDFQSLRQEGVALIQSLAGTTWTDYNSHDPGVTILEQFCYALTDLSYRINYDLEDLLASGGHGEDAADNCLFSPGEVLTGNAVTMIDFRKVVIDIEGVKNAWIEPVETPAPTTPYFDSGDQVLYLQSVPSYSKDAGRSTRKAISLRGLYRVLVEADQNVSNEDRSNLAQRVSQRLHTSRNLAEDFEPPIILDAQKITVKATVEIGHVEDPDQLLAQIHNALSDYVSPGISFHTLTEMLKRGKRIDEIMDGPVLDHGFIDTDELEPQRKSGLRTSDMIQLIMKIDDVRAVHQITVSDGHNEEAWYLDLDPAKSPVLADLNESVITLVRGKANAITDPSRVTTLLALQDASRLKSLPDSERDVPLPVGRDRHVEQYHSIQNQFPPVYGIGEFGLPSSASPTQQAQARQLKAYLMFFDQLLANAFSQLAHVKDLFSVKSGVTQSYFTQALNTVPGVVDVLVSSDLASHGAAVQAYAEDPEKGVTRRNRFLNHLLARFGEEFDDSSLPGGARAAEGLIEDKCAFLRDYPEIGAGRSRAFNYLLPSWDSDNVSGLERRIARKLGLASCRRRSLKDLASDDDGGFHLVEHILLRPRSPDEAQGKGATVNEWQAYATLANPLQDDPFSAQLTFVFPGWINRFADKGDNRSLIAGLVREETPAHLKIRLSWLEVENDMAAFEAAFRQMLEGLQTADIAAGAAPSA